MSKYKMSLKQWLESPAQNYLEPQPKQLTGAEIAKDKGHYIFLDKEQVKLVPRAPQGQTIMLMRQMEEGSPAAIGTEGLDENTALILYNPARKKALVANAGAISEDEVRSFLDLVRSGEILNKSVSSNAVEAHVIGGPMDARLPATDKELLLQETANTAETQWQTRASPKLQNTARFRDLRKLFKALERDRNIEIATFDTYDRPYPVTVAIDLESGKLIKGSKLVTGKEQASKEVEEGSHALTPYLIENAPSGFSSGTRLKNSPAVNIR